MTLSVYPFFEEYPNFKRRNYPSYLEDVYDGYVAYSSFVVGLMFTHVVFFPNANKGNDTPVTQSVVMKVRRRTVDCECSRCSRKNASWGLDEVLEQSASTEY